MPTGWSYEDLFFVVNSRGTIIRATGKATKINVSLDITSSGTPGVAYGRSVGTFTLIFTSNPIPQSTETLTLTFKSKGFKWGAQPKYVGHAAVASGGPFQNVTFNYPSSLQLNDTLIIITHSEDIISAAYQGFRRVGMVTLPDGSKLIVQAKAHWYSSETSVVIYSGDHVIGRIFALRGARSKPNYFGPGSTGWALPPTTTFVRQPDESPFFGARSDPTRVDQTPQFQQTRSSPRGPRQGIVQPIDIQGTIASVEECMILLMAAHGLDDSTANVWSAEKNPDLITILERFEDATTAGKGGGEMLTTAFLRHAFPDPFRDSTITNSLSSPPWGGAHMSIAPIAYPANDNFANATVIDPPITETPGLLRYDSGTYNATKETGEVVTIPPYSNTIHNTAWWKYTASRRQIVRVWLHRSEPIVYNSGELYAIPRKGTVVNALTQYATVTQDNPTSFGSDSGRGQSTYTAGPPYSVYNPDIPLRIQVTSDTPLYLQVGRYDNTGSGDTLYQLILDITPPPTNDDFSSATVITDGVDNTAVFVLDAATGQPGWIPTPRYGSSYYDRSWGDIWYKIQPSVDRKFGIKIDRNLLSPTVDNFHIKGQMFQGTSLGDITFIREIQGADANYGTFHSEFDLTAGSTYYFVLFWDSLDYANEIFQLPVGGILDWRFFTPPSNDDFANAENLGTNDGGTTTVANLQGSTYEVDEPPIANGVWYTFTPVTGGWYTFTFGVVVHSDNYMSVSLDAFRGTSLATLTLVDTNTVGYNGTTATLALHPGETYKLRLSSTGTEVPDLESMTWALLSAPQAASDDFASRLTITGASGNQPFTQQGGTNQANEWTAYYWEDPPEASTWFEWTCPADGCYFFYVDFMVDPSIGYYYHGLAIYDDDPFDGNDHKVCGNENGEINSNTKVAFDAVSGQTYYIQSNIYSQSYADPDPAFLPPYNFELNWGVHTKVTNHLFANAITLTGDTGSTTGDTYGITTALEAGILADGLTLEEVATKINGFQLASGYLFPVGRVTWFKYVAPYPGIYIWQFDNINYYSSILVNFFHGTSPGSLTRCKRPTGYTSSGGWTYQDQDDGEYYVGEYCSYDNVWYYTEFEAGETYYIAVSGFTYHGPTTNYPDRYPHWSRADIYQGQWDLTYGFQPPDNDTYSTVRNNANNIGNLMRYIGYNHATQTPTTVYSYQSEGSNSAICSTIGGTAESGEPAHAGSAAVRSVWFHIKPSNTGKYRIWLESAGTIPIANNRIAIYEQTFSVNTLGTAKGSDSGVGSGDFADFIVTLNGGTDYMIAVDGDPGQFIIHWQKTPVLPPITTFARHKEEPDNLPGRFDVP